MYNIGDRIRIRFNGAEYDVTILTMVNNNWNVSLHNLDPDEYGVRVDEDDDLFYIKSGHILYKLPPLLKVACECGSEKVGSPVHSKWCPKCV